MNGKKHSYEVWIKLPDGPEFVVGKARTLEQAQFIRAQLVSCAEKAGWRYVYTISEVL